MNDDSALSSVVLPEPVPPETSTFSRARTHDASTSSMFSVNAPNPTSCSAVIDAPKRRIDSTGPSMASGGITALMREPSGSRASTIGLDSSTRRPTRLTMRSITAMRCASSRKRAGTLVSLPPFSTQMSCAPLTRMSLTLGSRNSGSIGPRPSTSCTTWSTMASRSACDIGVDSARRNSETARRTWSASTCSSWMRSSARRSSRSTSRRWSSALSCSTAPGASACARRASAASVSERPPFGTALVPAAGVGRAGALGVPAAAGAGTVGTGVGGAGSAGVAVAGLAVAGIAVAGIAAAGVAGDCAGVAGVGAAAGAGLAGRRASGSCAAGAPSAVAGEAGATKPRAMRSRIE
jgi:hypothetical protein